MSSPRSIESCYIFEIKLQPIKLWFQIYFFLLWNNCLTENNSISWISLVYNPCPKPTKIVNMTSCISGGDRPHSSNWASFVISLTFFFNSVSIDNLVKLFSYQYLFYSFISFLYKKLELSFFFQVTLVALLDYFSEQVCCLSSKYVRSAVHEKIDPRDSKSFAES